MKELEKTKRISIASVLTILIVLIAVLSYKRPKHNYAINTAETLESISQNTFFISLDKINNNEHLLVDIRSKIEFEKGHFPNAIHLDSPELLNDENSDLLASSNAQGKIMVLYGADPDQALIPYMLLKQLGYDRLKIAAIKIKYQQNQLKIISFNPKEEPIDIQKFIDDKINEAAVKSKPIPKKKTNPKKKIIPKMKKKKMPIEGGC